MGDLSSSGRETILAVPSFRDRIPVIVDRVTTVTGPGELVDVIATERGIAVNPRRRDLLDALAGSKLPIRPIEEIKDEVERLCADGVKEITLLGQTIDSWGKRLPGRPNLGDLLEAIHETDGLEREHA